MGQLETAKNIVEMRLAAWQCSTRDFSNVTCLFIIASLILLVYSEINQPYRLSSSLNEQSITVDFYQPYNSLKVDPLTAEYAGNLTGLAAAGNRQAQTPLIDMTGATLGAFVILNAKTLGRPWFLCNYSGQIRLRHLFYPGQRNKR